MLELVALIGIIVVVNGAALAMSRTGQSRVHSWAFKSGLAGLAGLPASLLVAPFMAMAGLVGGAPFLLTAAAAISFLALAVASLASAVLAVILWRAKASAHA
jgi:hypothetical protein